jgi:hypothetical protein
MNTEKLNSPLNPEILSKALDFIIAHPHYKREGGNLTKNDILGMMSTAWANGLLNFVIDMDLKEVIGCFEAHVIQKEKLWVMRSRFPKLEGIDEPVLFMDMTGKFRSDYKLSFSDMMRIICKCGEMTKSKKFYYRNFRHHYIYSLDKRRYNGEYKPKFFVFNKNTNFTV